MILFLFVSFAVFFSLHPQNAQGRRIPQNVAVANPTANEIAEVCKHLNLPCTVEVSDLMRLQLSKVEGRQSVFKRLHAQRES